MDLLDWIFTHWVGILQNIGIIGGLAFTGLSIRIDARVRRVQNLLHITEQHRDIWKHLQAQPEITRILDETADLAARPLTQKEIQFVNFLILHLNGVYRATKAGVFSEPEGMRADIRAFFTLPIPRAAWSKLRASHDRRFVQFVERTTGSRT